MFGKNAKVDLELNRDVEQLIKTGGKEKLLPIVQAGEPVLNEKYAFRCFLLRLGFKIGRASCRERVCLYV